MQSTNGGAVVIGASMAGLLAARVLADRFDQVTVVDRDDLPDGAVSRKGVPQGRHAHGLLASGELVLRNLFPGLMEELVTAGAERVTVRQARWWQYGGYRVGCPAPEGTFLSRPFLEAGVRQRVLSLPNVTLLRTAAYGLDLADGQVTGVVTGDADGTVTLPARFTVDASGRGSRVAHWLAEAGYPEPPVARVQMDMTYATRLYRRTAGRLPDGTWIVTISDPEQSGRLGVAFPIEGDRWIVTLAGFHGDSAPADDAGYLAFAESLPTGEVAGIIRDEEPAGDIVAHRLPSNQWRHLEKVKRHPCRFLAMGDAICSFNPVYGQGMSSAALQAVALGTCLDRYGPASDGLPRDFYRAAAKIIANPWAIAAGGDFCYPQTTGPKPPLVDTLNRYVKKAVIAAQHDPAVATAIYQVQNLLAPPPSLMKPPVMVRVLRSARKGPTGGPILGSARASARADGARPRGSRYAK
jgi:2-polyprenyl-6-methoxyphenol hydroxylase-like FAD-dependent oxidoreductase